MRKHHTVTVAEMEEFVREHEVLLARSTNEGKSMYSSLTGIYRISHPGGSEKFQYLGDAVRFYNSITEKFVDPTKNFTL